MWRLTSCAVTGRRHKISNELCQDIVNVTRIGNVDIIALADGAGSASRSRIGAQLSVDAAISYIATNWEDLYNDTDASSVKKKLLEHILSSLNECCEEVSCSIDDLASTLLVVAIRGDNFLLFHIGDGVIGYLRNNTVRVASYPSNGEFVNTTVFITSKNAISAIHAYKGVLDESVSGFVLMSDGTCESLFEKRNKKFSSGIKRIMQWNIVLPKDHIDSSLDKSFKEHVIKRTNDDCSIAVISRETKYLRGYFNMTYKQKFELLGMDGNHKSKVVRHRIKRYDSIMRLLVCPLTLREIAKKISLDPTYLRKSYMDILCDCGLVNIKDGHYYSLLY